MRPLENLQSAAEEPYIVRSYDYDGCVAYEIYGDNRIKTDLSNLPLRRLAETADEIFVGSARQSHFLDALNRSINNNGRCLHRFEEAFGKNLNKTLGSDIQRGKDTGYTLNQIPAGDRFDYIADEYKRTLLYSQIHAVATRRQLEEHVGAIVFEFYDDREDILTALNDFFTTNSDFIPKGVTLKLFQYKGSPGQQPKPFEADICGTGMADVNYVNTSNAMSKEVDLPLLGRLTQDQLDELNKKKQKKIALTEEEKKQKKTGCRKLTKDEQDELNSKRRGIIKEHSTGGRIDVVLSLDYDKCLADQQLLDVDPQRLALLIESAKTILVGSNRQSHGIDQANALKNSNGSCFPIFQGYPQFHSLLASDIQRGQDAGYTLNQIPDGDKFECIADEYKRTLIYSQVHAMATLRQSQGLTGNFVFKFVDDREDILAALNDFFTTNPDFIPKGVTLQLFQYCPRQNITLQQYGVDTGDIYGAGIIDANYVNTSNAISKLVDYPIACLDVPTDLDTLEKKEAFYNLQRSTIISELRRKVKDQTFIADSIRTPSRYVYGPGPAPKNTFDIDLSEKDQEDIVHIKLYAYAKARFPDFASDPIAFDVWRKTPKDAFKQLFPMVRAFTAASSKYPDFSYWPAEVVSPHQVSYKVEVKAKDPYMIPAKLQLVFTYNSKDNTWHVASHPEPHEEEDYSEFLNGHYDTLSPEAKGRAIPKLGSSDEVANDDEDAEDVHGLLVSGSGSGGEVVDTPSATSSSASVGAFEGIYRRMTQLQQRMVDLYSKEGLQEIGISEEGIDWLNEYEDLTLIPGTGTVEKIQTQMRQTMAGLNTLEDEVFRMLANVAQQFYLDDSRGNIIEQLLTKEDRDAILKRHQGKETYNPGASTLACIEEYKPTFIGRLADSRDDPSLWMNVRPNLMEELLDACVDRASKKGVSEADKAKGEWLMGVKAILHAILDTKDSLVSPYARLSHPDHKSLFLGDIRVFHSQIAQCDWPETLKQLGQLQVQIEEGANEDKKAELGAKSLELLHLVVTELGVIRGKQHDGVSSFSPDEAQAMKKAANDDLLLPLDVAGQNRVDVSPQSEMRRFKRIENMTPDQITALIAVTRQFRCFQWKPSQIDQGFEQSLKPRKIINELRSLEVPQDGVNWKKAAMIGGAVLGMATLAVLTVGSAGLLPAGFAVIGTAAYTTWQVGLMIAAGGVGGTGIGLSVNKLANWWSSKAEPLSLKEELKEYTPQQLRKAFFATVDDERPKEINRREMVRAAVKGQVDLFDKMFAPIDKRDGDYEQQSPQRDCFSRGNFSVPDNPSSPPAINSSNHVVHPREIARYFGSLADESEITRNKFMDKIENSPWIKRELAVFLVHAVLFDSATEDDRQLATKLMQDDSFKELRDSLFAPPLEEGSTNEQRLFIDSFLTQVSDDGSTLTIPSADEVSRKALLELMRGECVKQDDLLAKYRENKTKWEGNIFSDLPQEDLTTLLLAPGDLEDSSAKLASDVNRAWEYIQINGKRIEDIKPKADFYQLKEFNGENNVEVNRGDEKYNTTIMDGNFFGLLDPGEGLSEAVIGDMIAFAQRQFNLQAVMVNLDSLLLDVQTFNLLTDNTLVKYPFDGDKDFIVEEVVYKPYPPTKTFDFKRDGNRIIIKSTMVLKGYQDPDNADVNLTPIVDMSNSTTDYLTLEKGNAVEATSTVVMDFSNVDSKGNPTIVKDETHASVSFHPEVLRALNVSPKEAIDFSLANLGSQRDKIDKHLLEEKEKEKIKEKEEIKEEEEEEEEKQTVVLTGSSSDVHLNTTVVVPQGPQQQQSTAVVGFTGVVIQQQGPQQQPHEILGVDANASREEIESEAENKLSTYSPEGCVSVNEAKDVMLAAKDVSRQEAVKTAAEAAALLSVNNATLFQEGGVNTSGPKLDNDNSDPNYIYVEKHDKPPLEERSGGSSLSTI